MPDNVKSRFIFAWGRRYSLQQQKRHGGRSMLQLVSLFISSQEAESDAVYLTCIPSHLFLVQNPSLQNGVVHIHIITNYLWL